MKKAIAQKKVASAKKISKLSYWNLLALAQQKIIHEKNRT